MSSDEDILWAVEDEATIVALNRPDRLNAWTPAMQSGVRRAMVSGSRDNAVRVIVVTGAGRGICAGAGMAGLKQIRLAERGPEAARTGRQ